MARVLKRLYASVKPLFAPMDVIRIVLANHHPIVRTTLRELLEKEPSFEIVGEAANGREAVVLADYRRPDVVLLDIHLPFVNGMSAAAEIIARNSNAKVIMVTDLTDEEYLIEVFRSGARGYVRAETAQADLVRAIRTVAAGQWYLSRSIVSHLIEKQSDWEDTKDNLKALGVPAGLLDSMAAASF